jgi:GxxExxY protein
LDFVLKKEVVNVAINIESDIEETAKRVYKELGPGHQEVIYREAMSIELQDRGYMVKTEMPVSIRYTTTTGKVVIVGDSRADLCVEKSGEKAIIELKTVSPLLKKDKDGKEKEINMKDLFQLLKYLEALSEKKAFLINFPFPPRGEPEISEKSYEKGEDHQGLTTSIPDS